MILAIFALLSVIIPYLIIKSLISQPHLVFTIKLNGVEKLICRLFIETDT